MNLLLPFNIFQKGKQVVMGTGNLTACPIAGCYYEAALWQYPGTIVRVCFKSIIIITVTIFLQFC